MSDPGLLDAAGKAALDGLPAALASKVPQDTFDAFNFSVATALNGKSPVLYQAKPSAPFVTRPRDRDDMERDRGRNIFEFFSGASAYAMELAAKGGTGSYDMLPFIQAALDSGENIFFPPGRFTCVTDGLTAIMPAAKPGQQIVGAGRYKTTWKDISSNSVPYRSLLIAQGVGQVIEGIYFEINAGSRAMPQLIGGQYPLCHSVLLAEHRGTVQFCAVKGAWDNGFAIIKQNLTTGVVAPGSDRPSGCLLYNSYSEDCGSGVQQQSSPPMQVGAGFSNLNGWDSSIVKCEDYFSRQSFNVDVGAGGLTTIDDCHAYNPRLSTGGPFPTNPYTRPGGQGFYIGSLARIINSTSTFAQDVGFFFDGEIAGTEALNIRATLSGREGIVVRGDKVRVQGLAYDNSQDAAGARANLRLIGGQDVVIDVETTTSSGVSAPKCAFEITKDGAKVPSGVVRYGRNLDGATAPYLNEVPDSVIVRDSRFTSAASSGNMLPNPTFSNPVNGAPTTQGWVLVPGSSPAAGTASSPGGRQWIVNTTPGQSVCLYSEPMPINPGEQVRVRASIKNDRNSGNCFVIVDFLDGDRVGISGSVQTIGFDETKGSFVTIDGLTTAPAGASYMRMFLGADAASTGSVTFGGRSSVRRT